MVYLKSVPYLLVFGPLRLSELPPEREEAVEACDMAAGTAISMARAAEAAIARRRIRVLILTSPLVVVDCLGILATPCSGHVIFPGSLYHAGDVQRKRVMRASVSRYSG
jgi:hypothetical protein